VSVYAESLNGALSRVCLLASLCASLFSHTTRRENSQIDIPAAVVTVAALAVVVRPSATEDAY